MGTLRSLTNHAGQTIENVLLGDPVTSDSDPVVYAWDHHAFPDAWIDPDGNLIPDE